ncbi:alpha/beta fold hydrolase [Mycoplasma procyoni]|uniref:alpha/beta fold hydrolase n=1 Tax=Mycoplasma procyoni TaxID=568784 RepID=UPI00197B6AA0|nr:alpha/beta hydrolase [Mycoplasma procyoni]MBN3534866.1 alpha/beta hydrolase [Mycoplasma procyoni]
MKEIKYDYNFVYKKGLKPELKPIIFVHGFNSSPRTHKIFEDAWNLSDYYAIQFPGNNLVEPKNNEEISVYSFADILIKFIEENNLKDVILVGHSMGGGTISLAYKKRPDLFSKLIYVAPMNKTSLATTEDYFKTYFPKTFAEWKTFMKALYYDPEVSLFNNKELMEQCEKDFDPYLYHNENTLKLGKSLPNMELMNSIEEGLKSINVPTLLVLGEKDAVIDRENCIKYFRENVKNIQIEVFEKTGHLMFNENFQKYFKILKDFILGDQNV